MTPSHWRIVSYTSCSLSNYAVTLELRSGILRRFRKFRLGVVNFILQYGYFSRTDGRRKIGKKLWYEKLSGWEFLRWWDSKSYHASFVVGILQHENTRPRVTEDLRARTVDCDRKIKSQYSREVAHGRIPRTHATFWVLKVVLSLGWSHGKHNRVFSTNFSPQEIHTLTRHAIHENKQIINDYKVVKFLRDRYAKELEG